MSSLSLHNVCCLGKVRTNVSKLMAKYWLLGWGWEYKELLVVGAEVCSCCKMGLKQKPIWLKFVVKVLGVVSGCFLHYFIQEQGSAWPYLDSFVILWYPTVLSPLLSGWYISSFSSFSSPGAFPDHSRLLISTACPSPLGRDIRPCIPCLTLASLLHWGSFN